MHEHEDILQKTIGLLEDAEKAREGLLAKSVRSLTRQMSQKLTSLKSQDTSPSLFHRCMPMQRILTAMRPVSLCPAHTCGVGGEMSFTFIDICGTSWLRRR